VDLAIVLGCFFVSWMGLRFVLGLHKVPNDTIRVGGRAEDVEVPRYGCLRHVLAWTGAGWITVLVAKYILHGP
jgi:hypothetical protein